MAANIPDFIVYAADRGTVIEDTPQTAAALVRAQDYIKYHYLQFGSCTPDSENVAEATYEAAIFEVNNPGFWTNTYTPAQQKLLTAVDVIKWTPITGDPDKEGAYIPRSTKIDMMLRQCGGLANLSLGSTGPYTV